MTLEETVSVFWQDLNKKPIPSLIKKMFSNTNLINEYQIVKDGSVIKQNKFWRRFASIYFDLKMERRYRYDHG